MLRGRLVWGSFEAPPAERQGAAALSEPPMSSTLFAGTTTGAENYNRSDELEIRLGEIVAHTLSGADDKPLGTSRKREVGMADKPPI